MRNVLITGITGQCGSTLADMLLKRDYKVYGTYRRISTPNFWRLQYFGILDKVNLIPADITDMASIQEALKISKPDYIFNCAAQSFVGSSFESPIHSAITTGVSVTNLLEAMRQISPNSRLVQFSTSEMFGAGREGSLNEGSGFMPSSPYGCAKLYGFHMVKNYREAYNMFCSNVIMFNTESEVRGLEFVTRKITNAVARIKLGMQDKLVLGNLDSVRDWSYCPDSMEGVLKIMTNDEPGDFVIASGESHTVREFVEEAFNAVDLDYHDYVVTDKKYMRPLDVGYLKGDYNKAKKELGWEPKVKFKELVKLMVDADMQRWQNWKDGKSQFWDAQNYNEDVVLSSKMKLEKV